MRGPTSTAVLRTPLCLHRSARRRSSTWLRVLVSKPTINRDGMAGEAMSARWTCIVGWALGLGLTAIAAGCSDGRRGGGGLDAGDSGGATDVVGTSAADGVARDARGGVDAGLSGACSVAPYPNGMACTTPGQACVPDSGFDCCICYPTHGCALSVQWGCITSYPDCPASPPVVGEPCTMTTMVDCVYCSNPPVDVACSNGKWATIGSELYCN
jgi:hypothetical protein